MKVSINPSTDLKCYHCGEGCVDETIHSAEKTFCCEGCKMVFEILNENNLCNYYNLSSSPGITAKGKFNSEKYAYLDDEKVKAKLLAFTDGKQSNVLFSLPQMHCSSCIWLLENLHRVDPAIIRSQVNFPKKEVSISFEERIISLRKVVELLSYVGYEPTISLNDLEDKKIKSNKHKQLYKIGIAGFCFGNIMMMSFPEYFSSGKINDASLSKLFSYINLFLSLPVFFYCSAEFFVSAWKGIQQRFLNIDAPIALAIFVTFARSAEEILSHRGVGYLDSMSGIVFFMLLGRFFQNKTYDTLSFERNYKSYFPVSVTLLKDKNTKAVIPVTDLKVGDRILLRNNELIPADSILFRGEAFVDYSFVTGEEKPVHKIVGEIIYAGGKQVGTAIELEVIKEVSQSYLTELWNNDTFKKEKSDNTSFIHKVGKHFSVFLLLLAFGAFLFWLQTDYKRALNAFTAVLIVACPCALLLSATFTNGNILRILGKNKFYLKNANVIERLANIDTIVFDKTGTITQNNSSKINYEGEPLTIDELMVIKSVVAESTHPLSKQIFDSLASYKTLEINNFKEYAGQGIEATVLKHQIKLGSLDFVSEEKRLKNNSLSQVYFSIDGIIKGVFLIQNHYRNSLESLINSLVNTYQLRLLSGDNDSEKIVLKKYFYQGEKALNFNQSPKDKLTFIEALQKKHHTVAMIGDGLNDAGALSKSDVGIAVSDNINNFSPACDAILDGSRFKDLKTFFDFAKAGKKIIIASFIISLLYNSVGLAFAVTGYLSPVIAAILMPISSISIVLFTTLSSNIVAFKKGMN